MSKFYLSYDLEPLTADQVICNKGNARNCARTYYLTKEPIMFLLAKCIGAKNDQANNWEYWSGGLTAAILSYCLTLDEGWVHIPQAWNRKGGGIPDFWGVYVGEKSEDIIAPLLVENKRAHKNLDAAIADLHKYNAHVPAGENVSGIHVPRIRFGLATAGRQFQFFAYNLENTKSGKDTWKPTNLGEPLDAGTDELEVIERLDNIKTTTEKLLRLAKAEANAKDGPKQGLKSSPRATPKKSPSPEISPKQHKTQSEDRSDKHSKTDAQHIKTRTKTEQKEKGKREKHGDSDTGSEHLDGHKDDKHGRKKKKIEDQARH